MFNFHTSDVLQHWSVTHALALQMVSDRTLRDMQRLPPHLIDDVNARGLPADVKPMLRPIANDNRSRKIIASIKSIRLIDA